MGFVRTTLRHSAIVAAIAVSTFPRTHASANEPIAVTVDQARLMKLPERVATVVIGNPLIADVSLQPGGMLVITGKGYGTTNLVILDRNGSPIIDRLIEVQGPRDNVMVIHRGLDRETHSCTPVCERRITLGDTPKYFDATLGQTGQFADQAAGKAGAPKN